MKKIRKHSCGIDIGSKEIFVAIEGKAVRSFLTFTSDIMSCADYLLENGVKSVAMEATGSYWFVLYRILEERGLDVWLVDGRETKQVPGRKTDIKDCQWIQQLHSYGLLNRCFVLEEKMQELRSYERLRETLIESKSTQILRMQKALLEMNLRIKEVLSQIHGTSGLNMIRAILSGERDKHKLLSLCHISIRKHKSEEILKSLEGYYTPSGLFALQQGLEAYEFYRQQIHSCDKKIEEIIHALGGDKKDKDLDKSRKVIRHNKPNISDLGANLLAINQGIDATQVEGITDYTWLKLISELGCDLSKWATEKHFTSWLGLAPGQHWSGKKKRSKRKSSQPKAGLIFRNIAQSLMLSKHSPLGVFGRRIRSKKGPQVAIKAVARKLAEIYWKLYNEGLNYVQMSVEKYTEILQYKKRKTVEKLAKELNLQINEKQSVTQACH